MNKSFRLNLDPVANAKTLGILYILSSLGITLDALFSAIGTGLTASYTPINIIFIPLNLLVGIGLIKKKFWAVYLLGMEITIHIIILSYKLIMNNSLTQWDEIIGLVFGITIFFWFYSAKDRFNSY